MSDSLRLQYPIRQSIAFSNTMFRLYNQAISSVENEICFDLSRSQRLTPFGIIMLSATVLECQKRGKKCKYNKPVNRRLNDFMTECGFTKFFGLESQKDERDLIRIGRVQLIKANGVDYFLLENITEIVDFHLNISPGVKGSIRMSLQETMTNVVDHSRGNRY